MSSNKIAEYLRLKDNHPTMIKLQKLYALAIELGIHLSFMGHACMVNDNEIDQDLPTMTIEYTDDGHNITEWPPSTEFKVICKNPEYIRKQKQEHDEWLVKKAEENFYKRQVEETARRLEQERLAAQKECDERQLLKQLKEKYPDA